MGSSYLHSNFTWTESSPSTSLCIRKLETPVTRRWRPHASAFCHFNTIPECDGQTDGQTDGRICRSIYSACKASFAVCRHKRTPGGNSTSGFDFEFFIVIAMWFCTDVPNFIRIGRSATELWCYVDFPRWRPYGGYNVTNLLPLSGFTTFRI